MKVDEKGYNELYKSSVLDCGGSKEEFLKIMQGQLLPYSEGGLTKGYVRGLAVRYLLDYADATGKKFSDLVVLNAGCVLGGLSAFLALKGFNIVGVDI